MRVCEKHNCQLLPNGQCEVCLAAEERAEELERITSGKIMGIPRRFREATLAKCECDYYRLSPLQSEFITGKCGVGKTYLAAALAKDFYLTHQNYKPQDTGFLNFQEMVVRIKSSFRERAHESMQDILRTALQSSLVVLDDICTANPTPIAIDALYTIVNRRNENMLPTIYTTNYSLDEIKQLYGDMIASRLSACYYVEMALPDGRDRRIEESMRNSKK